MVPNKRTAIVIGAGPAGLTAAYELLARTDIKPIILEATGDIGGISRTVNYKGNRIDIGGHRFFSKSDRVLQWWQNILPLQGSSSGETVAPASGAPEFRDSAAADPEKTDKVLLVRERVSRIFFLGRLFDYPLSLGYDTLSGLGLFRTSRIALSYIKSWARPIRPERSLEDFFVNRFGRELYATFFRDYTEKVWGVPCTQISPEWGEQRVKGLSIRRAIVDAVRALLARNGSVSQKQVETSLIRRFLYPKFGPGQMWEEVARIIQEKGGEIHLGHRVTGLRSDGRKLTAVVVQDADGRTSERSGDYFFSTMPVKDLVAGLTPSAPEDVRQVAAGLIYRDFITVGLLLKRLRIRGGRRASNGNGLIPDCWLYIQEPYVKVGRIQIFNNWSPYLVADPDTVWIGLEYFCSEGDTLWRTPAGDLVGLAVDEMCRLGFIEREDVLDSTVLKTPKTYPAYFGTYHQFDRIRDYTDGFENLFLIGRNGMHRYNNQDHSMLTAMTAVETIVDSRRDKQGIWAVNTEEAYHEGK